MAIAERSHVEEIQHHLDDRDVYAYTPGDTAEELEKHWFHRILVAINAPAHWPAWQTAGLIVALVAAIGVIWWRLAGQPGAARIVVPALLLFSLTDALVLGHLPRKRISFGPVQAQAFILLLPRLAVTLLLGLSVPAAGLGFPVALTLALNAAASLALFWGSHIEPTRLELSRLSLAAVPWPEEAPPLTILHISDLHVERFGQREERLIQMVQDLRPDVILLTGDYVNLSYVDDPVAHADVRRVLANLRAPCGAYAVLGSPPVDRRSSPDFDGLPIRLLRNEMMTIDPGEGRRITLLGVDCGHDLDLDTSRLRSLVSRAPADTLRVLLHHSPDLMPAASACGIDLYFCGHTHGGQVRLPLYGAILTSSKHGKRFEMGSYRLGDTHLYVSRGIGMEGMGAPRVRFLCRPEVTLFTIATSARGNSRYGCPERPARR